MGFSVKTGEKPVETLIAKMASKIAATKKPVAVCTLMVAILTLGLVWHRNLSAVGLSSKTRRSSDEYYITRPHMNSLRDPLVATLGVDTSTPVNIVDKRFVSVGITLGSFTRKLGKIFNSTRFKTVARGLAPAVYRIGGAEADFTEFDSGVDPEDDLPSDDPDDNLLNEKYGKLSFYNMTLYGDTWDNANEFARDVGWDILFTLNALKRNGSAWDPTNAIELLEYTKRKGHRVLWALGNEPNGYKRKANVSYNGTQMAAAFHTLRDVMGQDLGMGGALLSGPDTSAPRKSGEKGSLGSTEGYLNDFLQEIGNVTNVTSFHFYYTSGRAACFFNFTDPFLADLLEPNIAIIRSSVTKYRPLRSKIWITESGITFGSGTPGLDVNFVSGFLTLDKLGMSARLGADLVVQQNLAGKTGGLLDETFYPRVPYWYLLYHKRLMGTRVLDVSKVITGNVVDEDKLLVGSLNFTSYLRTYAHCTKTSTMYTSGSVTLMIINMVPIQEVTLNVEGSLRVSNIHEYLFTPQGALGLLSPHAMLSGQRLKMTDDYTLPYHKPRVLPAGSSIAIPPMTYGFYVFPDAAAPACLMES